MQQHSHSNLEPTVSLYRQSKIQTKVRRDQSSPEGFAQFHLAVCDAIPVRHTTLGACVTYLRELWTDVIVKDHVVLSRSNYKRANLN